MAQRRRTRGPAARRSEARAHAAARAGGATLWPAVAHAAARIAPSTRSLIAGGLIAAVAIGGYVAARSTSVFAIQSIRVHGVGLKEQARVAAALQPLLDTSLVTFDAGRAFTHLAPLPEIATASFDRSFPHTLDVTVRADRASAVLRQGSRAWLLGQGGRVIRELTTRPYPPRPRVWVGTDVDVAVGAILPATVAAATRALTVAARDRITWVRAVEIDLDGLTLLARTGPEVRLGDGGDLALKLAVAQRIRAVAADAGYVDVSMPDRPVAYDPAVAASEQAAAAQAEADAQAQASTMNADSGAAVDLSQIAATGSTEPVAAAADGTASGGTDAATSTDAGSTAGTSTDANTRVGG